MLFCSGPHMSVRVSRICGCGHTLFLPVYKCPSGTTLCPRPRPRAQVHARIRVHRVGCPRVDGFFLPIAIFIIFIRAHIKKL
jgi:hypothetical protein